MASPLSPQRTQMIDSLPGFWGTKDLQSTFLYFNQPHAELIGLRHKEEAIGMTDLDIPCGAVESAHLFRAQDREVIRSGQTLRILDIHCYSGNKWRSLLTCKAPLRDQEQKAIGIIYQLQELDSKELVALGVLLGKEPVRISV